MKIATWDVTAALLLTAVALCVTWVLKRRHQQQLFQRYGIPGPKPDFFFGNWMQLKKDRLKVMEKWIEEYGKVFGFYEGEVPKVVISDLEIIKKCFVKDSHVFRDRGPFVVEVEPIKSSLLFLKGDEWKRMRSVLNPIFSTAKMKLMSQVMSDCANTLVEVISHQLSTGRAVVNATELSQGLSLDVVTKCALAWQYFRILAGEEYCLHTSDQDSASASLTVRVTLLASSPVVKEQAHASKKNIFISSIIVGAKPLDALLVRSCHLLKCHELDMRRNNVLPYLCERSAKQVSRPAGGRPNNCREVTDMSNAVALRPTQITLQFHESCPV